MSRSCRKYPELVTISQIHLEEAASAREEPSCRRRRLASYLRRHCCLDSKCNTWTHQPCTSMPSNQTGLMYLQSSSECKLRSTMMTALCRMSEQTSRHLASRSSTPPCQRCHCLNHHPTRKDKLHVPLPCSATPRASPAPC